MHFSSASDELQALNSSFTIGSIFASFEVEVQVVRNACGGFEAHLSPTALP
jgi:hypothetical protein